MKSIYKFGYQIESDALDWINTINKIFGIDIIHIYESISEDGSNLDKEQMWYKLFEILEIHKPIQIGNINILKLYPRINRYQSYVYFILVIDGDLLIDNNGISAEFKSFREHIIKSTKGFVDNFKIPFKEPDFLEDTKEYNKYYEVVYLKNPVLILDAKDELKHIEMDEIKTRFGSIYYKYEYTKEFYYSEDKEKYMRALDQTYFVDMNNKENIDKSIKDIVDHFHSIFIIFHRSSSFYSELKCMDAELEMITLISDKLNNIWPKERLSLLLINRFKNMELYNKTFFAVLELNSQLY